MSLWTTVIIIIITFRVRTEPGCRLQRWDLYYDWTTLSTV